MLLIKTKGPQQHAEALFCGRVKNQTLKYTIERSQEYCISELGTDLSILWFKHAASGRFKDLSDCKFTLWWNWYYYILICYFSSSAEQNTDIVEFLGCAKANPDLCTSILNYTPLQTPSAYSWDLWPSTILNDIRQMVRGKFLVTNFRLTSS